ncbi:MAG: hypothetical protein GY851_09995 [bacterium]|nr:hypothetical protein [bacterium]
MPCFRPLSFLLTFIAVCAVSEAQDRDIRSDTWDATDALGRRLPGVVETGPPRANRAVGVFYFLWLGEHGQTGPHDIPKILEANPGAFSDASHPAWGPPNAYHHWGESIFGYYVSDDKAVMRKHAEMLADAGVDMVIFDVTNRYTYKKSYTALCEAFTEARAAGTDAPDIAFLCPFGNAGGVVRELYKDFYGPGLYRDLWFEWDGKPFIMADPAVVFGELRAFFTFRKPIPSYFTGPVGPDNWGWLEVFPQHVYRDADGNVDQMVVGVSQNAVGDRLAAFSQTSAKGRSFHGGRTSARPDAVWRGLNFAEQWRRALAIDPELLFITGWNEWDAMRLPEFNHVKEPVMFVDQFSQECSRDVEPMEGGHSDVYYYQMTAGIRRYKGVRPQPRASAPKTIALDGGADQWTSVGPEYRDHKGDPANRNHPGWGEAGPYVNETGRNDMVSAKVARDDAFLYFRVQTAASITPPSGTEWMMLLIDMDRDRRTGWEGYDFVVNRTALGERAIVERNVSGWEWERTGEIDYHVDGACLTLAIPRAMLGVGAPIDIGFKWTDNTQCNGDISRFIVNGDTAPSGRFNYRYCE